MTQQTFKYVYIPANSEEPIQQKELVIPTERKIECLLDELKKHYVSTNPLTTQQRQRHVENLKKEMGSQVKNTDDSLLWNATGMQLVENVGLLVNNKDTDYIGVNMYVDDSGLIKNLPPNERASAIAQSCGKITAVRGDAFIARILDDEDRFERLDFTLDEVSSGAEWVKQANLQSQQRASDESPQEALQRMQENSSKPKIVELTEEQSQSIAAKEEGNVAFKKGKYQEAIESYNKAIELDKCNAAALNNRAMALLKTGDPNGAIEDCNRVINMSGIIDVCCKAYYRRGLAQMEINKLQEALEDFRQVRKLDPHNTAATAKGSEVLKKINQQQKQSTETVT